MNNKEKMIKKLVNIGLHYNVDYIYVLEDIENVLEGKITDIDKIKLENYLD